MDLTQLVVSELVTNVRKYAPRPVPMELRIVGAVVEAVVWDSDPVARAAGAGRVGQHGLEIVMTVALGFEVQRDPVGKRITVRIALPDDLGGGVTGCGPSSSQRMMKEWVQDEGVCAASSAASAGSGGGIDLGGEQHGAHEHGGSTDADG
jgi:hypothetical protein